MAKDFNGNYWFNKFNRIRVELSQKLIDETEQSYLHHRAVLPKSVLKAMYLTSDKFTKNHAYSVRAILANLLDAICQGGNGAEVSIVFKHEWWKKSSAQVRKHCCARKPTLAILRTLELDGLIKIRKGYRAKNGHTLPTRFSATEKLLAKIRHIIKSASDITVNDQIQDQELNEVFLNVLRTDSQESKERVDISENESTELEHIKNELKLLNETNLGYQWAIETNTNRRLPPSNFVPTKNNPRLYLIKKRALVYSRSFATTQDKSIRWDLHGRYFNSAISEIHREERSNILINGEETTEMDFKANYVNICYNLLNLPAFNGDPYSIDGYSTRMRPIIKQAMLTVFNCKDRKSAVNSVQGSINFDKSNPTSRLFHADSIIEENKTTVSDIIKKILTLHEQIALYFFKASWKTLSSYESTIASKIIKRFTDQGCPIFVVHDSFVVRKSDENLLYQAMTSSYKEVLGFEPLIETKTKPAKIA